MFPLSYQELDSLVLTLDEIQGYENNPIYRKATSNMALATMACNKILDKNAISGELKSQTSFVLGTAFGEVESSLSFLKTHKEEGIARPNLFQNSLHNSTLGFVTIQLGLVGPAITVSSGAQTFESTQQTALSLLTITDYVLACVIDVTPESLQAYYQEAFPEVQPHIGKAQCWLWKRN